MDMENLTTAREGNNDRENFSRDIQGLREKLRSEIAQSRLSDQEKKEDLHWLTSDPKSSDRKTLQTWLEQLPKSESFREQTLKAYEQKFDRAASQNLVAKNRKNAYMDWARNLPTGELMKYLLKDDLDRPERVEVLETFRRLPAATRKEIEEKFNASGLEERQKLVAAAKKKHEALKAAFLALPKGIQKQYREEFKRRGLGNREKLLKIIGQGGALPEAVEPQKLRAEFERQMIEDGVKQNLFSPLSIEPNLIWLNSLPIEKQRTVVHEKQSDLYLRMEERVRVRDEFKALPEGVKRPHELRFRNFDLDRRKELLRQLKKPERATPYPDDVLRRTLAITLQTLELQEQLLIHTLLMTEYTLGRRAAIRTDAVYQEDIAEKTEERGRESDDYQELYLTDLQMHRENRQGLRRRLLDRNKTLTNQNALETNTKFLNKERREVSAQEFKNTVVAGQRAELIARLVELASQKLPNADRRAIQKLAEKMDLLVDLHKLAA